MKRFELIFAFIQLPLDFLMIFLAGVSAYFLRYTPFVTSIRPILFDLSWSKFYPILLTAASAWIIIYALSGLYTSDSNRKIADDLLRIINASSNAFAAITIYVFFTLQKFDSRFLVLAGWIFAMIYVFLGRLAIKGIKLLLYKKGIGLKPTVIIGGEAIAATIEDALKSESHFGQKIIGSFPKFNEPEQKQILALEPQEIIYTCAGNETEALRAIDFASKNHISFKYSADLFETISSNMKMSTISGIPLIELRRTSLTGWGRILKRITDLILAIFFLMLFSPLILISAIIILIESGLPIFYKNERVGQYNQKFYTLKFRSMYQKYSTGTEFGKAGEEALKLENELIKTSSVKNGPIYKIVNDPRITPFGRFIRRWSIDELPQFWNVLRGEMSIVGPRPHQPREVEKYVDSHSILLEIKPGITGMAQISGRSNLSFEEEAKLDTFYIEHWSLYLDLIILVKTPFIILFGKGAW